MVSEGHHGLMDAPGDPVFVGGSGHSGTSIAARLIGRHSRYAYVPMEVNIQAEPRGLAGLLAGRVELSAALEHLRGRYRWLHHGGGERGIRQIADESVYEALLADFERDYPAGGADACATLLRRLLDPLAAEQGKPSWVEMTPLNASAAATLMRVFPQARVLHLARDGRDVAARVVRRGAPLTAIGALEWWRKKLIHAEHARRACPPGTVLVLQLEDLVRDDRERAYGRLLAFLGVEDEPAMHAYFHTEVVAANARMGRWREQVPAAEHDVFEARHREIVSELLGRGVAGVPAQPG